MQHIVGAGSGHGKRLDKIWFSSAGIIVWILSRPSQYLVSRGLYQCVALISSSPPTPAKTQMRRGNDAVAKPQVNSIPADSNHHPLGSNLRHALAPRASAIDSSPAKAPLLPVGIILATPESGPPVFMIRCHLTALKERMMDHGAYCSAV
ncbi:predicted protein [Plenodomus lingam JN3]|uniref:Predicted protein n=1 Tax=Leptosphaeria maculans (strain JN3 / isolate v23.1.3 / race Av1-4-5-6-7-8) TaxID=985895 RepID=E5A7Y2_LEPMJ|nr:predicted protein [Plenodomus lingam JN3]CBX99727.1 predicted protein [Plenodomus lingam JN3]